MAREGIIRVHSALMNTVKPNMIEESFAWTGIWNKRTSESNLCVPHRTNWGRFPKGEQFPYCFAFYIFTEISIFPEISFPEFGISHCRVFWIDVSQYQNCCVGSNRFIYSRKTDRWCIFSSFTEQKAKKWRFSWRSRWTTIQRSSNSFQIYHFNQLSTFQRYFMIQLEIIVKYLPVWLAPNFLF